MNNNKKHYLLDKYHTKSSFLNEYSDDIHQIFEIISKNYTDNNFKITNKDKLLKNLIDYIYHKSDTIKLNE